MCCQKSSETWPQAGTCRRQGANRLEGLNQAGLFDLRIDCALYVYKSKRGYQAVFKGRIKDICETRVRCRCRLVHVLRPNLGLVLWPPRPRRQDRGAVMAGHLGIGSVDPGIVTIGLVTAALRLSQTMNFGTPPRNRNRLACTPIQSDRLSLGQASA
jgi:hypothetical protein